MECLVLLLLIKSLLVVENCLIFVDFHISLNKSFLRRIFLLIAKQFSFDKQNPSFFQFRFFCILLRSLSHSLFCFLIHSHSVNNICFYRTDLKGKWNLGFIEWKLKHCNSLSLSLSLSLSTSSSTCSHFSVGNLVLFGGGVKWSFECCWCVWCDNK
jgi:hypothetical protein